MELREIEIFLTLAEELHFGRTADQLYLSPSRVSQTIRALEGRIGGRLFERTRRSVQLTPLGERLRDGLRPAYDEIHRVVGAARDDATGITGELRIGTCSHPAAGPLMTQIIGLFEERHPGCRVDFKERLWVEGWNDLRRGDLDILVAWLPIDEPDWRVGPTLTRQERVLAVQVGHPLAHRGHASVEDLADYAVIDVPGAPDANFDRLLPPRTPSGRTIQRRYPTSKPLDAFILVARGLIVHPTTPAAEVYYPYPGVTYIPLQGLPTLESALVWRTVAETAAVRAFAAVAEEVRGNAGA